MTEPINFLNDAFNTIHIKTKNTLIKHIELIPINVDYIISEIEVLEDSIESDLYNIENSLIQDMKNNNHIEEWYENENYIKLYLKNYYNKIKKILSFVIFELNSFKNNLKDNINIIINKINNISKFQSNLQKYLYDIIPNIKINWNFKELSKESIGIINTKGEFIINPKSPSLDELFTIRINFIQTPSESCEDDSSITIPEVKTKQFLKGGILQDPLKLYFNNKLLKENKNDLDDDNYSSIPFEIKYDSHI